MKILNSLKLPGAMLGLTVLLTACLGNSEGGVTPPPAVLPGTVLDSNRVQGTVPSWTFGAGEIAFYLSEADDIIDGTPIEISTAGALNSVLPVPTALGSYLGACKLSAGATGSDFQTEYATPLAYSSAGDFLGSITETTTDGLSVDRVFTASAASLKGVAICNSSLKLDLDFTLTAGWNALSSVRTVGGGVTTYTVRNLSSGTRVQLALDKAEEKVNLYFPNPTLPTLRPSQSASLPAVLFQTGAINGAVTLETDVPGVTITPGTLNLAPLSASSIGKTGLAAASLEPQRLQTNLTFNVSADAISYSGPLNVIVKKAGNEVGRTVINNFNLVAPQVYVEIPQQTNAVLERGQSTEVRVNLISQNEFSGSTTVTFKNLPLGVTSSTENISLSSGGRAEGIIILTADKNVDLGKSTISVTGSKIIGSVDHPAILPLTIIPARIPLAFLPQLATPAVDGVWIMNESKSIPINGTVGTNSQIVRLQGGLIAQTELVAGDALLLPTSNGDAVLVSDVYVAADYTVYHDVIYIKPDGTRIVRRLTAAEGGQSLRYGAVDSQGNLWFNKQNVNGPNSASAFLSKLNINSGEIIQVDETRQYSVFDKMISSPDGRTIIVTPYLPPVKSIRKINTMTSDVSEITINDTAILSDPSVVDNGSNTYFSYFEGLYKLNSDSTSKRFTLDAFPKLIGMDRKDNNTLWLTSGSVVIKLNIITGTYEKVYVSKNGLSSSVLSGSPANNGGVWITIAETDYTNGNYQYKSFATYLN